MEISRSQAVDVVRRLGQQNYYVYSVMWLLSRDGVCSLKQDELADRLGMSVSTMYRRIRELTRPVDGVGPLIRVERQSDMNVYRLATVQIGHECTIGQICDSLLLKETVLDVLDVLDGELKELTELKERKDVQSVKRDKPHVDAMKHWSTVYHETYGVKFAPGNYALAVKQMRTLLDRYDGDVDRVKAIIDVVMRLYSAKWATTGFTRPTVGQLLSWLAAQAEPFVQAAVAEITESTIESETDVGLFDVHDGRFGL